MHRRLIVMRHAKSSWKVQGLEDFDRPLNKRGQRDAAIVGTHLQEIGWIPELILSSDSRRTRETYQLMLSHFQPQPPVELTPELYLGGTHELRNAVATTPHEVNTVLVLGHNPGSEQAIAWLCGEEVVLKTANAALLESRGDNWREALNGEHLWQLIDIVRPKELAQRP